MLLPLNARTPKARMAGGWAVRQTGGQATYVPEEGGCGGGDARQAGGPGTRTRSLRRKG